MYLTMASLSGDKKRIPTAVVFANPDVISLGFVKLLFDSGLVVKVVSRKEKLWRQKELLPDKGAFEILALKDKKLELFCDYVVLVVGFSEKDRSENYQKRLEEFASLALSLAQSSDAKFMVIAPYVQDENFYRSEIVGFVKAEAKRKKIDLRLSYVGQAIGPRGILEQSDLVSSIVKAAAFSKEIKLPKQDVKLYPVNVEELLPSLKRTLFSFGYEDGDAAVIPKPVTAGGFFEQVKRLAPYVKAKDVDIKESYYYPNIKKVVVATNLSRCLQETFGFLSKDFLKPKIVKKKKKDTKKSQGKKTSRVKGFAIFSFALLLFVLLIPFYLLLLSASSILLAKNDLEQGNLGRASRFFTLTQNSASFAEKGLIRYSEMPLVGGFFAPGALMAGLLERSGVIGKRAVLLSVYSSELLEKILGNEPYKVKTITGKITVEIDSLYNDLGFLQGEVAASFGLSKKVLGAFSANDGVLNLREKVLLTKKIFGELPGLLGSEQRKTYLVLFQNNMELRPTGGFIGSFAIVSFENGRLIDISVQDVYSADGQLKGHVEPPPPIKNYLGEANWYLRDSNWDPDFPTSAQRAEWFLDKELDISVDGVIGIDLEVAREILKQTGPILITDFNQLVDYNNLYEKTQYEVEKDFFPGSRKKASFLTALARELLMRLSNMGSSDYIKVTTSVFDSLNERHVQVFLHNSQAARIISEFGWDGAVRIPSCSGNCFADWLGIVEANLGVNKANFFIRRSFSLIVSFQNGRVERFLSTTFVNDASPLLGEIAKYKLYTRIMMPPESEVLRVEVVRGTEKQVLEPEIKLTQGRKEVGVFLEIGPGKTSTLNISWSQNVGLGFGSPGIYSLYWRKQAGTREDPVVVRLFFPRGLKVYAVPSFSLTDVVSYGYNFLLAKDLNSRVSW